MDTTLRQRLDAALLSELTEAIEAIEAHGHDLEALTVIERVLDIQDELDDEADEDEDSDKTDNADEPYILKVAQIMVDEMRDYLAAKNMWITNQNHADKKRFLDEFTHMLDKHDELVRVIMAGGCDEEKAIIEGRKHAHQAPILK